MKRFAVALMTLVLAAPATTALAGTTLHAKAHGRAAPPVGESGRPVIDWNRTLISIVGTPGAQPPNIQPTWSFAVLHAAIYDAVDSVDHTSAPYAISVRAPRGASATAAADAAARTVLTVLYPTQGATIADGYAAEIARVPEGPGRDAGIRVGDRVARAILALRTDDGSNVAAPPFVPGTSPGSYRPTPPNLAPPVFANWGVVEPFVLERGDQFRPAPPPALTSPEYAAALSEVQRLGSSISTTRTAEQTAIGTFWSPPIQNFWNQIAEVVATSNGTDLPTAARLFASLDLSIADATIALYDAKYTYQLWRPVTAIRLADSDGNARTTADPNWLPLVVTTPADPSYPGAHSTISAAAREVLARFYGDRERFSITSPALPGATRSFASFGAAAQEAGLSRIYAGVHTRIDHRAGLWLGRDVARYVLDTALQPD